MTHPSPADQVRHFAALLAGTDIAQLELRTAHGVLRVRRDGAAAPPPAASPVAAPPEIAPVVTAPSPGAFLHRHPLHDIPLVSLGQALAPGQMVGFLRIAMLLLPVAASSGGIVTEFAAAHGETVGYGAPLLRLRAL